MATSKREAIMLRLVAVLGPTTGISGRVFRAVPEGASRDDIPCINLDWSAEQPSPETVPMLERTLTVNVSVLTRGDTPDALADPIVADAHSRIMADATLNGLAIDTRLESASFEVVSADQSAGKLTHEYSIKFRHSYSDMTT